MDNIDKIVKKLSNPFVKISDSLVKIGLGYDKLTLDEIAELDIDSIIMQELGGTELVGAVADASSLVARAKNPALSDAIGHLGDQFFIRDLGDAGAKVKQVMAEAFVSELPQEAVKNMLMDAVSRLSDEKIGALLNTAIRTTERAAYASAVSDLPDDTIFEYTGEPLIETSRPFCRHWYGREITKGELMTLMNDSGEPAISAAGGYNCRHQFEEKVGKLIT